MVTVVVLSMVQSVVADIFPPLASALNHKEVEVRKVVVLAMVNMYLLIGKAMDIYLSVLTETQVRTLRQSHAGLRTNLFLCRSADWSHSMSIVIVPSHIRHSIVYNKHVSVACALYAKNLLHTCRYFQEARGCINRGLKLQLSYLSCRVSCAKQICNRQLQSMYSKLLLAHSVCACTTSP